MTRSTAECFIARSDAESLLRLRLPVSYLNVFLRFVNIDIIFVLLIDRHWTLEGILEVGSGGQCHLVDDPTIRQPVSTLPYDNNSLY